MHCIFESNILVSVVLEDNRRETIPSDICQDELISAIYITSVIFTSGIMLKAVINVLMECLFISMALNSLL